MTRKAPEIIEVDTSQLDALLRRVEGKLEEQDYELVQAIFRSYTYVTDLVEDKNTSIRRLRQLLFGAQTEKTASIFKSDMPSDDQTRAGTTPSDASPEDESIADGPGEDDTKERTRTPHRRRISGCRAG